MSTNQTSESPHIGKDRLVPIPADTTKKARVQLVDDPRYAARLEVFFDGTTWRYGIHDDRRATFLDARRNGEEVEVGEPDWMWSIFNGLDIRDS